MTINLLPWRQQRLRSREIRLSLALLFIGIIAVTILWYWHVQLSNKTKYYAQLHRQLLNQFNALKTSENFVNLDGQLAAVSKHISLIKAVTADQKQFWHEWSLLQDKIPKQFLLNEVRWNPTELQLQGNTTDLKIFASTVKALETCPQFSAINLQNLTVVQKTNLIHFTLIIFYKA
ncbi:MAG: PilN domain-containing protein [Proteobacteria bacterium]|nr:PilN domain-containing protein [Pseudomonadota bacterium]